TAGVLARLARQCPCATRLPDVRVLCRAHDTSVRPLVPLACPHGGATLGCLSPVRAMVVQPPELARDVRPQLRSSLAEVGCSLHHPLGWDIGVYLDDDVGHAVAVPPLATNQTNSHDADRARRLTTRHVR